MLFEDRGTPHKAEGSLELAAALDIEVRLLTRATPELNAMDHLWRQVKARTLADRPTRSIDDSADAACRYIPNRNPSDTEREVARVSDLTFGEYLRLLQNPDNWDRLGIFIDRKLFVERLNRIRLIRNDVMHFDPDGLSPADLELLRGFVLFLQKLRDLTDNKQS